MARLARVVVPGYPHHVIQRGNRRQQTFFEHADYRTYIELMAERTGRPLDSKRFVSKLERLLDRSLHPRKTGRPAQ